MREAISGFMPPNFVCCQRLLNSYSPLVGCLDSKYKQARLFLVRSVLSSFLAIYISSMSITFMQFWIASSYFFSLSFHRAMLLSRVIISSKQSDQNLSQNLSASLEQKQVQGNLFSCAYRVPNWAIQYARTSMIWMVRSLDSLVYVTTTCSQYSMAVFGSLFVMALSAASSFPSTVSVLMGYYMILDAFVEDLAGESLQAMRFSSSIGLGYECCSEGGKILTTIYTGYLGMGLSSILLGLILAIGTTFAGQMHPPISFLLYLSYTQYR